MYCLRLDPEQVRLLKLVKAREGVLQSEQIRRALAMWSPGLPIGTAERLGSHSS